MNDQYSKYADDIEDFLSGSMDPEREKAFREALENNDALSEAFTFRTNVAQYWNEEKKYSDTKDRVRHIMASQKRSSKFQLRYLYLAASVLLLLGVSLVLWRTVAPGGSLQEFAASKDSAKQQEQTVTISKQPEKASLYAALKKYALKDTLALVRQTEWPDSVTLVVMNMDENTEVGSYVMQATTDTLFIPLNQYMPGSFRWTMTGEAISGVFIIDATKQ